MSQEQQSKQIYLREGFSKSRGKRGNWFLHSCHQRELQEYQVPGFLLVTDRAICLSKKGVEGFTHTWVFPVNVNTVKIVVLHEICNVSCKLLAISRTGSLAENLVCGRLRREVPAAEADNSLRTRDKLEVLELIVGRFVVDADFIVGGDIGKTEM